MLPERNICLDYLENTDIDPITDEPLNEEDKQYYLNLCQQNITKIYSGIKEVDIEIFSYVDDEVLNKLCQTNKYIKSLCPAVYLEKIYYDNYILY